ncbi:MAG: gamma-glutamyltransferase, partial [Saprospiraceae bacterium]
KFPQLADFLDYLWREGKDAFYQGEIAQKIVEDYREKGGFLTLQDFADYEVKIRQPLHFTYREQTILTTPAPSIGGMLVQLVLQHLAQQSKFPSHRSAAYIKCLYDIFVKVNQIGKVPEKLHAALQQWQQKAWGSTTHFSIADRWGNIVSLTVSNGEGCGYFVEGTDIQLNNMLGEAVLMPNGFHSWQENVRLNSMMTPTIVLDKNLHPTTALGTGGAGRIAFAIAQILHLLIDHKHSLQEAVAASRLHLEHNTFHIEAGFEALPPTDQLPHEVKYWQQRSLFFGGVHAIQQQGKHWTGVGDDRREGVAITLT